MYKFILLLFFMTSWTHAAVFFIDTNNNDLEIQAAREQAQANGEEFYHYPENKDDHIDHAKLKELLVEHTPDTVFISGHDGGGMISGHQGGIDRDFFSDLQKTNPEVAQGIRVLGLMGCNTANHAEVIDWKALMPNLAFIAGYDGSAPTQKWLQGRQYIKEIIEKKNAILDLQDEAKIKDAFMSFSNFDVLQATLYFDSPRCNNPEFYEDQYMYRPKNPDGEFGIFMDNSCGEKITRFEREMKDLFESYMDGSVEIPEDTSEGPLREMYTFIRQNEHCLRVLENEEGYPSGNDALFLLFFRAVQENFVAYYGDTLDKYFVELKLFGDSEHLDRKRIEVLDDLNKRKEYLDKIKKNPSILKEMIEKRKKELEAIVASYPADYPAKAQEILDRYNSGESSEALLAELTPREREFIKIFFEHQGFTQYVYDNRDNIIESLGEDIEYYQEDINYDLSEYSDENWETTKTALMESYQKIADVRPQDLATMPRSKVLEFIHAAEEFDMDFTNHPQFFENTQDAFDTILDSVDGESIHFNWHDANMGDPIDPLYSSLEKSEIDESYNAPRNQDRLEKSILEELTGYYFD